jgi:nucleoside-diphosphate-sugar epimerase
MAKAPALHVDAAAWAAVLAIEKAHRGIYNIAEPSGYRLPSCNGTLM